ncbi:MAG: hypothetical protein ACI8RZ_006391 [Myxococcota bacterium]|jgi:hypothetical protein
MIKNSALLLSVVFLLAACGDKEDDSGTTDSGDTTDTDTTDTTDESITPEDGDWYSGEKVIEKDTCGFGDEGEDTGSKDDSVTLTVTSETTFTLDDGDKFNASCTFDSAGAFICEPQVEMSDYTTHGVDAILTISQSFGGSFSSSTEGNLTLSIDASCEGGDCGFLTKKGGITLPCTTSASFTISHGG